MADPEYVKVSHLAVRAKLGDTENVLEPNLKCNLWSVDLGKRSFISNPKFRLHANNHGNSETEDGNLATLLQVVSIRTTSCTSCTSIQSQWSQFTLSIRTTSAASIQSQWSQFTLSIRTSSHLLISSCQCCQNKSSLMAKGLESTR